MSRNASTVSGWHGIIARCVDMVLPLLKVRVRLVFTCQRSCVCHLSSTAMHTTYSIHNGAPLLLVFERAMDTAPFFHSLSLRTAV